MIETQLGAINFPTNPTKGQVYTDPVSGKSFRFDGDGWTAIGPAGPPGPPGPVGPMGPQGPQGEKGDQGVPGKDGKDGPQGPEGPRGPIGPKGDPGQSTVIVGDFGAIKGPGDLPPNGFIPKDWDGPGNPPADKQFKVGEALIYSPADEQNPLYGHVFNYVGITSSFENRGWADFGDIKGPKGDKGDQGVPGPKGDEGKIGPEGPAGPKGDEGPRGPQGFQGPKGDQGEKGDRGEGGPPGPKGDTGAKGDQGAPGPVGPEGPQGPKGDKGDPGDPATLPIASQTQLGGIKVGSGLVIGGDGTLDTIAGQGDVLPGKVYQIPYYPADGSTVGPTNAVSYYQGCLTVGAPKQSGSLYLYDDSGGGVEIFPSVNASTKWNFYLPNNGGSAGQVLTRVGGGTAWQNPPQIQPATTTALGGIKIGASFDIDSGGALLLRPALATVVGGVKVSNENNGINITADGKISVPHASEATFGGLKLGKHLRSNGVDGTVEVSFDPYVLPPATPVTLGGVKPGDGIAIQADGTISVSGSSATSVANVLVFDGTGTTTWTPPNDCTFARMTVIGGGGAGGDCNDFSGGGGGGGGATASAVLRVRPNYKFDIVVGAGGTGNKDGFGNGGAGGESSVTVKTETGELHKILTASGGSGGKRGSLTDDLPADGGGGGFPWIFTDAFYIQAESDWGQRGGEGGMGLNYYSLKWPHNSGRFRIPGTGGNSSVGGGAVFLNAEAYGSGGAGGTDRLGQTFGKAGRNGMCIIEYDGTPQTHTPLPPQFDAYEFQQDGKVKLTFTPAASAGPHVEAKTFDLATYDVMTNTSRIDELTILPSGQLASVIDWLLPGRIYDLTIRGVNNYGPGAWSEPKTFTMPGFPFSLQVLGNRNGGADFQLNGFGLDLDEYIVSATYTITMNSKVIQTNTYVGSKAEFYTLGVVYANNVCLPYARLGFYPKTTTPVTGNKYIYEGYEKLEFPFGPGVCTCDVKLSDGRTAKLSVDFNNDMMIPLGSPDVESAEMPSRDQMVVRFKPILNPIPNSAVNAIYVKINFWWVKYPIRKDVDKIFKCEFKTDDTGVTVTIPLDWPDPIEGADWKLWLDLFAQIKGADGKTYTTPVTTTLNEEPGCGLPEKVLLTPTLTEVKWQKSTSTFYVTGKYNLIPGDPNKSAFPDGVWSAIIGANGYHYSVSKDTLDSGDLISDCRTKDLSIPSGTVLTYRIYSMYRSKITWIDSDVTYKVP